MAFSKLYIFFLVSIFLVLIVTLTEVGEKLVVGSDNSEAFRIELDKLTSKILSLESIIDEKNKELKDKDETIAHKEKAIAEKEETIKEKSDIITSLQSQLASPDVHCSWLPPWRAASLVGIQSYVESHWGERGKPAFESLKQKTLEKKTEAERWAEPHVQTIKTKWVPAAKEQLESVITNVEPQLQSLNEKTKEVYIQSKDTNSIYDQT